MDGDQLLGEVSNAAGKNMTPNPRRLIARDRETTQGGRGLSYSQTELYQPGLRNRSTRSLSCPAGIRQVITASQLQGQPIVIHGDQDMSFAQNELVDDTTTFHHTQDSDAAYYEQQKKKKDQEQESRIDSAPGQGREFGDVLEMSVRLVHAMDKEEPCCTDARKGQEADNWQLDISSSEEEIAAAPTVAVVRPYGPSSSESEFSPRAATPVPSTSVVDPSEQDSASPQTSASDGFESPDEAPPNNESIPGFCFSGEMHVRVNLTNVPLVHVQEHATVTVRRIQSDTTLASRTIRAQIHIKRNLDMHISNMGPEIVTSGILAATSHSVTESDVSGVLEAAALQEIAVAAIEAQGDIGMDAASSSSSSSQGSLPPPQTALLSSSNIFLTPAQLRLQSNNLGVLFLQDYFCFSSVKSMWSSDSLKFLMTSSIQFLDEKCDALHQLLKNCTTYNGHAIIFDSLLHCMVEHVPNISPSLQLFGDGSAYEVDAIFLEMKQEILWVHDAINAIADIRADISLIFSSLLNYTDVPDCLADFFLAAQLLTEVSFNTQPDLIDRKSWLGSRIIQLNRQQLVSLQSWYTTDDWAPFQYRSGIVTNTLFIDDSIEQLQVFTYHRFNPIGAYNAQFFQDFFSALDNIIYLKVKPFLANYLVTPRELDIFLSRVGIPRPDFMTFQSTVTFIEATQLLGGFYMYLLEKGIPQFAIDKYLDDCHLNRQHMGYVLQMLGPNEAYIPIEYRKVMLFLIGHSRESFLKVCSAFLKSCARETRGVLVQLQNYQLPCDPMNPLPVSGMLLDRLRLLLVTRGMSMSSFYNFVSRRDMLNSALLEVCERSQISGHPMVMSKLVGVVDRAYQLRFFQTNHPLSGYPVGSGTEDLTDVQLPFRYICSLTTALNEYQQKISICKAAVDDMVQSLVQELQQPE